MSTSAHLAVLCIYITRAPRDSAQKASDYTYQVAFAHPHSPANTRSSLKAGIPPEVQDEADKGFLLVVSQQVHLVVEADNFLVVRSKVPSFLT